ncbi:MAG: FecR domain-containing protein [Opitutaceae bacterium]|nr:FecR domain-containing protein [Opitutaceae bacterium]
MNDKKDTPPVDMESEASLWAARLDGTQLTLGQRRELDRWLEEDPRHRKLLERYCRLSADIEPVARAAVQAGRLSVPAGEAPRAGWLHWAPWTVAATAVAAIALWAWWPANPTWQDAKFATAAAQRQDVRLSDGSRVELNAGSSLVLEEGRTERRTRLASGEAFFSVARDGERPFLVETPAGVIRVTGTSFNVSVDHGRAIEVTVVEGSVQVSPGGANRPPVSLKGGDRLVSTPAKVTVSKLEPEEQERVLSWRTGRIVFSDTSLSEALARFSKYHGRSIVAEASVADLKVGGRFSLDDLEGFLSSLETILSVKVTRDLGGTIHVGLRP